MRGSGRCRRGGRPGPPSFPRGERGRPRAGPGSGGAGSGAECCLPRFSSLHRYTFLKKEKQLLIFCLYTKSAPLADKASHGAVTGAPVPAPGPRLCSSAANFPAPGRRRQLGLCPRCRSLRLLRRSVSATGSCRRREHKAAWLGRCVGDRDVSALLRLLPKEQLPAPLSPGEQSAAGAIGRRNEQGSVLSGFGFHCTESQWFFSCRRTGI